MLLTQLITGLTGERSRWTLDVDNLLSQRERLVGDCLIGSSFLSYLGAFTAEFRTVS
jgi:dynein heavy chain, axonemal